jgi:Surface antigen variable number repeat
MLYARSRLIRALAGFGYDRRTHMLIIILLASLLTTLQTQDAKATQPIKQNPDLISSVCSQPAVERDALIREAEGNQFIVRRVEFLGNAHTSDFVLRRRMINLTEGDVFTRGNLVKSLASVSKLKAMIHPVKLGDVMIHLDRAEKLIDMEICFREKPQSHRRAERSSGKRAS